MLRFAPDSARREKNYPLELDAFILLNDKKTELMTIKDQPAEKMTLYLNAADALVLSSLWEGSPNIVKEGMACNCPVVTTPVGDVCWLFGPEPGYYLAEFEAQDMAQKIKSAISFSQKYGSTDGRKRLIHLSLDEKSVSFKIIEIYKKCLE